MAIIDSEFHIIYNNYKDIRAASLKSYILAQLSNMLLAIKNRDLSHRREATEVEQSFRDRNDLIKRNVNNLLNIAKRDTWSCDPEPSQNPNSKLLKCYAKQLN